MESPTESYRPDESSGMKPLKVCSSLPAACLLALSIWLLVPLGLKARPRDAARLQEPIRVSLIDQLAPQTNGPAFNGLEERRRGTIFSAALRQVADEGKMPPVIVINRDLDIPSSVPDEPKLPSGTRLVRIYLTQWSRTRLGGVADTEILCRFYVERSRDGRVEEKLGPFFAHKRYDVVTTATPQDVWTQYQGAARSAIEQMAVALELLKTR